MPADKGQGISKDHRRSLAFLDPDAPAALMRGATAPAMMNRGGTEQFGWQCRVKSYEQVGPKWAPNVDFHAQAMAPGKAPENLRFRFADLKSLHYELKSTLGENKEKLPKLPDQASVEKTGRRGICAILCCCCAGKARDDRVEHVQQFMAELCMVLRDIHGGYDDFPSLCKPFGAFIRRAAIASRLQARSEAVIKGNFAETEMVSIEAVELQEEKRASYFDPVADIIEEALVGHQRSTAPAGSLARGPWRRGTRETRGGRVSQRPSGSARGSQAIASPRRSLLLAPLGGDGAPGSFDRTASPLRDPPGAAPQKFEMVGDVVAPPSFGALDAGPPSFGAPSFGSPDAAPPRSWGSTDVSFGGAAAGGAIFSQASAQRGRRLSGDRLGSVDASGFVPLDAPPASAGVPAHWSIEEDRDDLGEQEDGDNVAHCMSFELPDQLRRISAADAENGTSRASCCAYPVEHTHVASGSFAGGAPAQALAAQAEDAPPKTDLEVVSVPDAEEQEKADPPETTSAAAAEVAVPSARIADEAPNEVAPKAGAPKEVQFEEEPLQTSPRHRTTFKRFSATDAVTRSEHPPDHPMSPRQPERGKFRRGKSEVFQPIALDESLANETVFESKPLLSRADTKMTPIGSPRMSTAQGQKWEGLPMSPTKTDPRRLSPRPLTVLRKQGTAPVGKTYSDAARAGRSSDLPAGKSDSLRRDPRSWDANESGAAAQSEEACDAIRGRPQNES